MQTGKHVYESVAEHLASVVEEIRGRYADAMRKANAYGDNAENVMYWRGRAWAYDDALDYLNNEIELFKTNAVQQPDDKRDTTPAPASSPPDTSAIDQGWTVETALAAAIEEERHAGLARGGDWKVINDPDVMQGCDVETYDPAEGRTISLVTDRGYFMDFATATFVARSRSAVPRLVSALRWALGELERNKRTADQLAAFGAYVAHESETIAGAVALINEARDVAAGLSAEVATESVERSGELISVDEWLTRYGCLRPALVADDMEKLRKERDDARADLAERERGLSLARDELERLRRERDRAIEERDATSADLSAALARHELELSNARALYVARLEELMHAFEDAQEASQRDAAHYERIRASSAARATAWGDAMQRVQGLLAADMKGVNK